MAALDLITIVACVVSVHAVARLWRHREAPGATACLLLFAAAGTFLCGAVLAAPPVAGPSLLSSVVTYAVVALLLAVMLRAMQSARPRRRDVIVLALITGVVVGADVLYYTTGLDFDGAVPTPHAVVAGIVTGGLCFYRSSVSDLRPIARSVLIDSVRDGMMVVDQQRRVIDCNQAAAALIGEPRPALVGRPAAELMPREFAAMLQSTVHLRAELAVDADGSRAWFEVDVTPLDVAGRPAGHLIIARDISERRQVQDALQESRRALETANARLVEQSVTDPLTGLKNRRFLFHRLNEEISRHRRSGGTLGLLVVDLDHFKAVNDTHGHPAGDAALVQVAATLQHSVRDCDVVARLGGEEFAILAVNTERDGLQKLAERICAAIARTHVARDSDRPMILTASIGIASPHPEGCSADALFAEADRYLYEAKRQGRNRVVMAPAAVAPARAYRR